MDSSFIWTLFAVGILTAASFALLMGKGARMVPGYSALSEKEKAKVDTKKMCRKMGLVMLAVDCIMVLLLAITYMSESAQVRTYASYGLMGLVVISVVVTDWLDFTGIRK